MLAVPPCYWHCRTMMSLLPASACQRLRQILQKYLWPLGLAGELPAGLDQAQALLVWLLLWDWQCTVQQVQLPISLTWSACASTSDVEHFSLTCDIWAFPFKVLCTTWAGNGAPELQGWCPGLEGGCPTKAASRSPPQPLV